MRTPRKVSRDERPSASHINEIVDCLASLRPISTPTVRSTWTANGVKHDTTSPKGGGGLDLSKFAFGWAGTVPGTTRVRINGGPVQMSNTVVWVASAEVDVGGDEGNRHVVYATSPGVVAAHSVLKSSFTGHDETAWRIPLYEVHLMGGQPVMDSILWTAIDLKTWFAAPP